MIFRRRRVSCEADGLILADQPQHRADTAGTACGRSPGPPGAAARRARWASAHRARRKLPHHQRRAPDLTLAAYGGPTLAAHLSPVGAPNFSRFTVPAVWLGAPKVRP